MESKIAKELDLSIIRYSRVEEDHRVLSKGLEIKPDQDILLSITSSGDNILNLLLERPKEIVAIDMSAAQNSILELKIAAINNLNYHDFLVLLGEDNSDDHERIKVYDEIKANLPQYAREYWDNHTDVLKDGLNSSGRLQKYIMKWFVIPFTKVVDPETLMKFFEAKNLEEQRLLFKQLPLQEIKEAFRDLIIHQIEGRSHSQLKFVTLTNDELIELMWTRFCRVSMEVPITDNFYYSLFVRGKRSSIDPAPDYLLPPYLTEDGFDKLKDLVNRIEIKTDSVENYISSCSVSIDKMNLSDIFEYMSQEDSYSLLSRLIKQMSIGGRIVYWNLFNDRFPSSSQKNILLLHDLSQQLQNIDRVCFYEVYVLQVS